MTTDDRLTMWLTDARRFVQEAWAIMGDPARQAEAAHKLEAADAALWFAQRAHGEKTRQEVPS